MDTQNSFAAAMTPRATVSHTANMAVSWKSSMKNFLARAYPTATVEELV